MPNYRVTADQLQKPLVISCASEDRAWKLAEIKAGKRLTNGLVEELPTRQDLKDQLAAREADNKSLKEIKGALIAENASIRAALAKISKLTDETSIVRAINIAKRTLEENQ